MTIINKQIAALIYRKIFHYGGVYSRTYTNWNRFDELDLSVKTVSVEDWQAKKKGLNFNFLFHNLCVFKFKKCVHDHLLSSLQSEIIVHNNSE